MLDAIPVVPLIPSSLMEFQEEGCEPPLAGLGRSDSVKVELLGKLPLGGGESLEEGFPANLVLGVNGSKHFLGPC